MGQKLSLVRRDFHLEHGFSALDPVTVLEMRGLDPNPVYEGTIRGSQVAKKALRRGDLEYAVMARKESILRQAKLRIFTSPDHECVVLVECEVASGLRTSHNVKRYAH
jgi:hypothetical protein